jgi:hypothetical protein
MGSEQNFSDFAIRGVGKMAIKRAHHQGQAVAPLAGQSQPLALLCCPFKRSSPQLQCCVCSDGQVFVKRQRESKGLVWRID